MEEVKPRSVPQTNGIKIENFANSLKMRQKMELSIYLKRQANYNQ